jgi:hypothetical protein
MTRSSSPRPGPARLLALLGPLAAAACTPAPRFDDDLGLLGTGMDDPYPSWLHVDEAGFVRTDRLPPVEGALLPGAGTAWRRGFSPAQTFVVRWPAVDPAVLPSWRAPTPGEGPVRLLDVTAGRWLPVFAELDAWPDQAEPALLVRPLERLTPGHDVAVVLTTELGPRPDRFQAVVDDRVAGPLEALVAPTAALLEAAEAAGLPPERVALAWDAPIDDGRVPLQAALAARDPGDLDWVFDDVREGTEAAPTAFRTARGTLTVTAVREPDGTLAIDPAAEVVRTGRFDTDLLVHVPEAVADAPAGTVPVVVFGHGIFGRPGLYLASEDHPDVLDLYEACGCIAVGVPWTGLSRDDLGLATGAGTDFTTLPRIPAGLVQAQVAVRTLVEALRDGAILDDPVFRGRDGQRLASTDVDYYGISLGGIEGAVLLAAGAPIDEAVLHVPGALWGTMLERSSNFAPLETLYVASVTDPFHRQVHYAWSQLHWDPVDPLSWAPALGGDRVLLQEALHDEQVPNLTTRALARSAGLPVVGPVSEDPWGLDRVPAPHDGSGLALHATDAPPPPDANRPAPITGAHETIRGLPGVADQTRTFLLEGRITHPCGDAPCGPDNPGG